MENNQESKRFKKKHIILRILFNICLKCENYPFFEQFRVYNCERWYIFYGVKEVNIQ